MKRNTGEGARKTGSVWNHSTWNNERGKHARRRPEEEGASKTSSVSALGSHQTE